MSRWGMIINLNTCIGCYNCMVACKQEHFLPMGVFFSRVLVGEIGEYPSPQKLVYPVLCNHCKDAACVEVCPAGATFKREDGIVVVDPEKCLGCRSCLIACPYQQRTFLEKQMAEHFPGQGLTPYEEIGKQLYPLEKGTVVKCNFCAERVDAGLEEGLVPGIDRLATPACVISCPTHSRHFGDLDDPRSNVSLLIRKSKAFPLHPEYGTQPSVFYILGQS